MKTKHILLIVENNPAPWDVRVWNEATALKEFGYEVSIISPKNEKAPLAYERIDGIDIYRHDIPFEAEGKAGFMAEYGTALFWEFVLSIKLYLRKPFHVIHAANPPDHLFLIALLFKGLGVKFIFDHHDIAPENYVAKFGKKDLFYKILCLMEKLTFKTSDVVISTNESYKRIAITRGKMDPSNVFVVRNGPTLEDVTFKPPNLVLKEGHQFLVVYVGVIGNQEGIDTLLEIVDYVVHRQKRDDIKFVVIGTGPDWQNMVDLCKSMGLDTYVRFTGFIPYEDFYEYLATADCCVNPEFANPFTDKSTMLKIMDYMTFGKPIVQFRTTEGEVTAKQSSAYVDANNVSDFGDTLLELLDNRQFAQKMGEFGKQRIVHELNWDMQKRNLYQAYIKLFN